MDELLLIVFKSLSACFILIKELSEIFVCVRLNEEAGRGDQDQLLHGL